MSGEIMSDTGKDQPGREVHIISPWVRPPVYSDGPEDRRDLRPVMIIPEESLPDGAVIVNGKGDGVIIEVRPAAIQPKRIDLVN